MRRRVLLLLPTTTYKSADFLEAARRLEIEVVVATERRQALEAVRPGHTLTLDFRRLEAGLKVVRDAHSKTPFSAVIGADDETTLLAARCAAMLGLPHNPQSAVQATRDKARLREALLDAGLRGPKFRCFARSVSPAEAARQVTYPCVLKPLSLSASRGVLRADDADGFVRAFERIGRILDSGDVRRGGPGAGALLVEDYIPGGEVAVEGLLQAGRLRLLALFDKPDALEGPTFEETIYVTPSRLEGRLQHAIVEETAAACRAIGLIEGPVHAELRIHQGLPWILELAARTIGGLCSRSLRFGAGVSLEELVLRHGLQLDIEDLERESKAAGVMMIPVPGSGTLREVRGLARARSVAGIEEVTLTVHRGAELVPLPEGHRYPGFIIARGETAVEVEAALRRAHGCLEFELAPG